MTDNCNIADRCVDHREVLVRLDRLEEDIRELAAQLRGKVDARELEDIIERRTKEIDELKEAIRRLNVSDARHSEALTGIHTLLKAFKETQDLLRQDYSKLSECYTQTSVHIASLTAIMKERSTPVPVNSSSIEKELKELKEEVKEDDKATMWSTIKTLFKDRLIIRGIFILLITLSIMIITRWNDVMEIIRMFAGK